MDTNEYERWERPVRPPDRRWPRSAVAIGGTILLGLGLVMTLYNLCKIEVGTGYQAVLIRREGLDLEPDMELAPLRKTASSTIRAYRLVAQTTAC